MVGGASFLGEVEESKTYKKHERDEFRVVFEAW
jgi:hypothetical protein